MNRFLKVSVFPLLLLALNSPTYCAGDVSPALGLEKTISLGELKGGIDHFAHDAARSRMLLASRGNNTVEILDLIAQRPSSQLADFAEPQGVEIAPEINRFLVANGKDGVCRIFDLTTLKETGRVDLKDDADNVRYDPAAKLFWVGYGSGGLAAIDAEKGELVADVKLESHPESFQLETHGSRIFVNVPKVHQIVVIDRAKKSVVGKWPIKDVSTHFPMALDEAHQRIFIGCRHPAKMAVLNSETGEMVTTLDIVGDTDDLWLDQARSLIYVTGGEGFITVISQKEADSYEVLEKIATAPGARTSFFMPKTSELYVAVPHKGTQQAEIRIYRAKLP